MKKIIALLFFCSLCTAVAAETVWTLKKNSDGIKVYIGKASDANIKTIKVICIVNASLSQLASLLLDTKAHVKWIYNTTLSYTVKQFSPSHQVYYSEVALAWPFTNRDVVVDMAITQDPASKTMYVTAFNTNNFVPEKKDKVRVPMSKATWAVTPIGNNQLSIEYIAQAKPGGSIPDWVINTFCTKGPFETFKNLKSLLESAAYQKARYDFIKD